MYLPIFFEPTPDLERFRTMLDTCGTWSRRNAVRTLDGRSMAALFEASAGHEALTLDDIVATSDPLVEVIHSGKNSLPMFNRFEKRFCRTDDDNASTELWGYNHQTMMPFTGPGYFVASINDKGELLIDYGRQPPRKPTSWPEIIPNSARLGSLVWGGMTDILRKVTSNVFIGRAWRNGKPEDNYFALYREDPPVAV
jgi:hypothetical protein